MKIEKLMTRDVRTCRPEDGLVEPARIMWENDCGCVPVVDAEARVIGMITDRDVCMGAYTQGRPLAEIPVPSVMSKTVHCCRPSDGVEDAEALMKTRQLRRLPVVNEVGRLVGLLSLNDIAREAARERAARDRHAALEAVGSTLASICAHRANEAALRSAALPSAPEQAVVTPGMPVRA
jgi:CBS-domain-containing membrane protein